ncbi:MAG: polysaccharide deacetylase family protein [Ferruginibacter sp.]
MFLIFSQHITNRLQYTCDFVFKELLHCEYSITAAIEDFKQFTGPKLNYTHTKLSEEEFWLLPHGLLFENNIQPQHIDCFTHNNKKAFFKSSGGDLAFDIFATTFYLLSRYEEYLPHSKDEYGRYHYKESVAYKEDFLQLPLINYWIKDFALALQARLPAFNFQFSTFSFLPTYDIDIAYSYKGKGFIRNIGGFLQAPSLERILVLLGIKRDPFDSYYWLHALHKHQNLHPVYFFLVAQKNGIYDKNILPFKPCMENLIAEHAAKYITGIHPSWQSGDDETMLKREKDILEFLSGRFVTFSRQHYIRFNLPAGYRRLIEAAITDDHSMGYGNINGFRASVASSFYWFDLEKNEITTLRIHPFCYMDANSFYEQQHTAQQAFDEMMYYYKVCKEVNGTLITLWHNNFVGTDKQFAGWRNVYEKFILQVQL